MENVLNNAFAAERWAKLGRANLARVLLRGKPLDGAPVSFWSVSVPKFAAAVYQAECLTPWLRLYGRD